MLQAIEDAEAARRAALEKWQQRVAGSLARVEAIAATPVAPDAAAQLADAEAEWRDVAVEAARSSWIRTPPARFGALVEAARAAIAAHERAEAERRAAAERRRSCCARPAISICERLENARAEHALDELEKARAEWEGLPGSVGAGAPRTQRMRDRFEAACRRAASGTELHERERSQRASRRRCRRSRAAVGRSRSSPRRRGMPCSSEWAIAPAEV